MKPLTLSTAAILGVAGLSLVAAKPWPSNPLPRVESSAAEGLTFTYRITSSSSDKRTREATNALTTVRMQNGNVRMDYIEGLNPMGQKEGYILIQGDASRMAIVSIKDKKAVVMSASAAGTGMGALLNNPLVKMKVSNSSFRYKDLGAGDEILGYKTRHVRTWSTVTVEIKLPMMPDQKSTSSDSADHWIATGMDVGAEELANWAKAFSAGVLASAPEIDEQIRKFTDEYSKSGLALRTTTWSTTTDGKGKAVSDVVTTEVTDLKKGSLDPSLFQIPKGYEVIDMEKMMSEMKTGDDAELSDDESKAAEKGGAGEAIKQGLGGLLKKKKKN